MIGAEDVTKNMNSINTGDAWLFAELPIFTFS